MSNINFKPLLSLERENELSKIIQGDCSEESKTQAVNELVEHNLRLAVHLAKILHAKRYLSDGIDLSDFISEGYLGLYEAAKRYNCDLGRFSTYASIWIKMKIVRFSENTGRNIRRPISVLYKLKKLYKLREENKSNESIIKELNLKSDFDLNTLDIVAKLYYEDSLDRELNDEEGFTVYDTIVSKDKTPFEKLKFKDDNIFIEGLVNELPDREKFIIANRYGEDSLTLQEIGQILNMTKERVRQLENLALTKLKKTIKQRSRNEKSPNNFKKNTPQKSA